MARIILIPALAIEAVDLTPVSQAIEATTEPILNQSIQFSIEWPREVGDPRELSEIPEIRLWFIRLDAEYPWLPIVLDWKAGELARYTAMLVPHQFGREGIQFNPEALEIFVMSKIFGAGLWLKRQGVEGQSRLKAMAQTLGYELEDDFFKLLN